MANSTDFVAYVVELMRPTAHVTARSMFGGHGLYADGLFFAIVDGDTLYLKCDAATCAQFDELDLPSFVYATSGGKGIAMSYRRSPDEALDSAPAMRPWLRLALGAALRAAAAKPKPAARRGTRRKARDKPLESSKPRARPTRRSAP